ncbi:CLUMA_CG018017, isoform A [Clunio marinus]|uniref:CLUMA_CG018017, isoform A n=1 Tax=Clunio marinus TaxID=568069 RepID=A0A1J1IYQ6_9DIPT|nr:CLUMA_CG018017, isoform A [Clunio marinus]
MKAIVRSSTCAIGENLLNLPVLKAQFMDQM